MTVPGEIWWSLHHFLETPHFGKALELWETCSETWTERDRSPETGQLPWDCTPGGAGAADRMLSLQAGSEKPTLISPAPTSILPGFLSSAGSGPEWGLSSGQSGIYVAAVSDFIQACPSSLTRFLLCWRVWWLCGWTSSSQVRHPRVFCYLCLPALTKSSQLSLRNTCQEKFWKKFALLFLAVIQDIDLQQNTIKPQNSEKYKAHSLYYNPTHPQKTLRSSWDQHYKWN